MLDRTKTMRYNKEVRLRKRTTITAQSCKGHRKENSTIKPEIPADENQQRIKTQVRWTLQKIIKWTRSRSRKANDKTIYWEFDPGSGRTLAVCLTHASRTRRFWWILRVTLELESGERVSNAWVTCPMERNSLGKLGVKPYIMVLSHGKIMKTPVP